VLFLFSDLLPTGGFHLESERKNAPIKAGKGKLAPVVGKQDDRQLEAS
jgi:hypothetical protein